MAGLNFPRNITELSFASKGSLDANIPIAGDFEIDMLLKRSTNSEDTFYLESQTGGELKFQINAAGALQTRVKETYHGSPTDTATSFVNLMHVNLSRTGQRFSTKLNGVEVASSDASRNVYATNLKYILSSQAADGKFAESVYMKLTTGGSSYTWFFDEDTTPADGDINERAVFLDSSGNGAHGGITNVTERVPTYLENGEIKRVSDDTVWGIVPPSFTLFTGDIGTGGGGSEPTTSTLVIDTLDDLPVSGTLLVRVMTTAGVILYAGTPTFVNGLTDIDLDIAEVPVGTDVDWVAFDIAGEQVAGKRQATVATEV